MSQTVIGFFKDQADASRAVRQLEGSGLAGSQIDLTPNQGDRSGQQGSADVNPVSGSERDENSVRRTMDDRTVDKEGRNTNRFTDFFNNLFGGDDDEEARRYSHAAQRSGAMVTVHARSRDEAVEAARVLDECGADDVDSGNEGRNASADRNEGQGSRSRIFDRQVEDRFRIRNANDGSRQS